MPFGEAIQLAQFILNAGGKGLSLASSIKKENQERNEKKKVDQKCSVTVSLLQRSAMHLQLGVELLLEHIHSNGERFQEYSTDEWCKLLEIASLSSGKTFTRHIAKLPWSLSQVIPDLLRLKDECGDKIAKAKELFQAAVLLASAVFQNEEKITFLLFTTASTIKLCASTLQRFDNPDLLSMLIVNTILQLEERWVPLPNRTFMTRPSHLTDALFIKQCIPGMFVFISSLVPHWRSHSQSRIQSLLRHSWKVGLLTLIDGKILLPELQRSFVQEGTTVDESDGIVAMAINHKGQLIVAEQENGRIKAISQNGDCLFVYQNPTINDHEVIGKPVALTIDQNDHVFVMATQSSHYVIIKYDSVGKVDQLFDMQQSLSQLDVPFSVGGMAVDSKGLIFVGNSAVGRIHIFKAVDNTMTLQSSMQLKSPFSFCIDQCDNLIVSQDDNLHIYKQVYREDDGVTWCHMEHKAKCVLKNEEWKNKDNILALARDDYFNRIVVVTSGEKTKKGPMLWFVKRDSASIAVSMPLRREKRNVCRKVCIASGKNGLFWSTEGISTINCAVSFDHVIHVAIRQDIS